MTATLAVQIVAGLILAGCTTLAGQVIVRNIRAGHRAGKERLDRARFAAAQTRSRRIAGGA